MSVHRHRPHTRPSVARLALGVAALVAASILPAPAVAAEQPAVRPAPASAAAPPREPAGPSIAYEEWLAHADDLIAFTPGGRVTEPFRPRASDRWQVDGRAPRALPAGRLTGRAMIPAERGRPAAGPAASAAPEREAPSPEPPSPAEPSPATPVPATPAPAAPTAAPPDPSAPASPDPSDAASPTPAAPVDAPADDPLVPPVPADGASIGVSAAVEPVAPAASASLSRQVFGFLPYWEVKGAATTLDYRVLSTIAYFSVGSDRYGNLLKRNSDGTLTTGWAGWTSSDMTAVMNAAHKAGTRVVLTVSVFAWTTSQATIQKELLGSSVRRARLAQQTAVAVRDRGADGVNLDFEPLVSGMEDEYVAFVRTLRAELDKLAPGYQITFDTTGYIGNYPLERLVGAGAADAVFVMGYDYRTASSGYVGSIDPLAGPAYDLADTVSAYTARVPASRVILGLPWYGRAWSTVSDAVNAKSQSGTKYGSSVAVLYASAVDLAAQHGRRWDSRELSAWTAYKRQNCTTTYGCVWSWRQLYYDDVYAQKRRYDLVNQRGLRGAGIWALGYQGARTEVWRALEEKFIDDTPDPVVSPAAFSPNGDGTLDTTRISFTGADPAATWRIAITTTSGGAVRDIATGSGKSGTGAWDGRNASGARVPDGTYRAVVTATAGGVTNTGAVDVVVDTRGPSVTSSTTPTAFSPNDDGTADTTVLRYTSGELLAGTARVYAGTRLIRSWSVTNRTSGAIRWDGRDGAGRVVGDGRYTFRVDVRDAAGARTVKDLGVVVDRTLTRVTWSRHFYPQDRDGYAPSSAIRFRLARSAKVTVRIVDMRGNVVRSLVSGRSLAAGSYAPLWNGRSSSGAFVPAGRYRAVVTASSWLSTTTMTRIVVADAFVVTAPSSIAAGKALTVTFRATEPLSTRPYAILTQSGRSGVKRTATRLSNGSYRVSFSVATGAPGAATVRIAARDAAGRWNSTLVTVTVSG